MSGISKSPGSPQIALLGVPIEIGASQRGTLMGPDALRTAGIGRVLEQLGFGVEDHGNLAVEAASVPEGPPPNNAKYYDDIKRWIRALSERAFLLARSGAIPIFMGGDHSLSMGSVNGVARHWQGLGRPVFVLWLDAHADYNTPATTMTDAGRSRMDADPARAALLLSRIRLGRFEEPSDLLGAAVFLASGASDFVTGQTLFVDGGFTG